MKVSAAQKCRADGYVTFKDDISIDEINKKIAMLDGFFSWGNIANGKVLLSYHGPWDQMILRDLNSIGTYLINGEFNFREGEQRIWKIQFNSNTSEWDEITPAFVYGMDCALSQEGLSIIYKALAEYTNNHDSEIADDILVELDKAEVYIDIDDLEV